MNYPMLINGYFYKYFLCPSQGLKVHLGNGQEKYLDSWINVDANFITAKVDVWANLLNPLPFRDQSVDLYVIEHLPDRHLQSHFNQMYKALRKNGGNKNWSTSRRKCMPQICRARYKMVFLIFLIAGGKYWRSPNEFYLL